DDIRSFENLGEALACDGVDAGVGRGCDDVMPLVAKPLYGFGADETGSSDDDDFHDFLLEVMNFTRKQDAPDQRERIFDCLVARITPKCRVTGIRGQRTRFVVASIVQTGGSANRSPASTHSQ